jgi:hypothetical protein
MKLALKVPGHVKITEWERCPAPGILCGKGKDNKRISNRFFEGDECYFIYFDTLDMARYTLPKGYLNQVSNQASFL